MLSVGVVAERLGVSERRVRALVAAGRLPAERVGRAWLIAPDALALVDGARAPGRPLGSRGAWRELLGEVAAPAFDASILRARYRGRARRLVFDAPDVASAIADEVLAIGGWSAAMRWDALVDEDAGAAHVVYISDDQHDAWRERHWAVPSPAGRIALRVVGRDVMSRLEADRAVPARVAAVDVAELGGVRVLEAAERLWSQ